MRPSPSAAAIDARRLCRGGLTDCLRRDAWLFAIILSYVALASAAAPFLRETFEPLAITHRSRPVLILTVAAVGFAAVCYPLRILIFVRPAEGLVMHLRTALRTSPFAGQALGGALLIPAVVAFFSAFSLFKGALSLAAAYDWDTTLARWDAALHGGVQPWQLLHPVLARPVVTAFIDRAYVLWFSVMGAVVVWQAFSDGAPRLRTQFFLTFVLSWILLGNVTAALLYSYGPCYYDRVVGPVGPFTELMAYLEAVSAEYALRAPAIQEMLWEHHRAGAYSVGGGIAAMPSLHVGMATLFALLGWRTNALLGALLTAYAIVILVGSVHLGWHYAVDGYMAVAGTWAIWAGVGRFLGRHDAGLRRRPVPVGGRAVTG